MEILLRLLTAQLNVEETLYSQFELWPALFGHVAVVADDTISLQLLRVLVNETREVWTTDLLFALDNELEIERNIAGTFEIALSRLDERDNIVLAIRRASRDNLPPSQLRVEGSRDPFLERLHRLDIIVAIDEKSLRARLRSGLSIHDWISVLDWKNLRPQSRHVHLFLHNLSTILDPKLLSRNTRLLQQSAEVL